MDYLRQLGGLIRYVVLPAALICGIIIVLGFATLNALAGCNSWDREQVEAGGACLTINGWDR